MYLLATILCCRLCVSAHVVLKEEDPTEEAEEVSGEEGQVDRGGTAQLHHYGHTAVQGVHTQGEGREQQP